MGCGCGGGQPRAAVQPAPVEPETGDWVVEYPSGRQEVMRGVSARRRAQREAIVTGGRAWKQP